jgi:hypothetical protein
MRRRGFLQATAAGATACFASVRAAASAPGAAEVAWSRKIPVRYEADVAVIGGGMAGVGAACAAATSGAKVILVERFAVAGGMLTTGGVANFCGQMTGQGEVFDEILADLRAWRAIGQEKRESVFHPEVLAFVLQELLLRRGVKLLLHARFADACVDGGRITEAVVCGKGGPEALRARQFVDCTGDADVARAAGFAVMKGRPSDGLQLPMSMMYFVRHVPPDAAVPDLPEGWLHPIATAKDLPMTSVWPDGPVGNAIKIKVPMFDSTDTESFTAGEIQGRRRMMEVMDFHRRVQKRPWMLGHCSPVIGIREGARIAGDYVLTVDDLRAGRAFDDAVARGTFMLDGHKPDDDKRTYILPEDQLAVPPYQIPLRCLVARDGKNLLMAGRCMSADQLALSSARVSTTCAMMGQAAGIAAAMAVKKNCPVRDLDPAAVRKEVEARGAALAVGKARKGAAG